MLMLLPCSSRHDMLKYMTKTREGHTDTLNEAAKQHFNLIKPSFTFLIVSLEIAKTNNFSLKILF